MRFLITVLLIITAIAVFPYTITKTDYNAYVDSLSLREKAAQLFFVYTPQGHVYQTVPGGMIPSIDYVKYLYRNGNNFSKKYKVPPFTGIDQEGGKVNRLKFLADFPSMNDLAHMNIDSAEAIIDSQLKLMTLAGINVNFSPVVDLCTMNSANMVRMDRSIASTEDSIIDFASVYLKKHRDMRIFPTVKHFPGYGNTYNNSDVSIYSFTGSKTEFMRNYSVFCALVPQTGFVMVSNLKYPMLDTVPAIMSESIISLIEPLNSSAIIITDDIACKAYKDPFSVLQRSYNAGADMFILMNHEIYEDMLDSLCYWIDEGIIDKKKLDDKLKKIILKKEYLFRMISNREI